MSEAATAVREEVQFQYVEIGQVQESKTNPRKHFAKDALSDLTKSIAEKGILVPLLVRPIWAEAGTAAGKVAAAGHEVYEILAGARRFRAAKAAGLERVPVLIREVNDEQALEIQVIENLQRKDVHPLEEAEGYKQLLAKGKYDVEGLAAKVGKSESYIYQRLKLAELVPAAKKAFEEEKITAGHAILLARLQPDQQKQGLDYCLDRWNKPSVRDLGEWIEREIHLDLARAPWQKDDEKLLPAAGACTTCPKRTGATPALFPDVKKGDTCTDPKCYRAKLSALVDLKLKQDATAQLISTEEGYSFNEEKALKKQYPSLLMSREYRKAGNQKCKSMKNGLIVHGDGAGTFIRICLNSKCKTHRDPHASRHSSPASSKPSKAEIAKRQREEARRQLNEAVAVAAFRDAATRKVEVGKEELRRIAAQLFWSMDQGADGIEDVFPREPKWAKVSDAEVKRMIVLCLLAPATSGYCGKDDRLFFESFMKRNKVDLAGIRKKLEAEAKAQTSVKKGTCRYCSCTEKKACRFRDLDDEMMSCSWVDDSKTLCNNPKCIAAEEKAKKEKKAA